MFKTIVLPTRPQPDTCVAIFLLKKYGRKIFDGIENCVYEVLSIPPEGKTEKDYFREGKILIDIGGGIFDHHNKNPKTTASNLVSDALGIRKEPTIQKLLAYAERDDFYGKGTQSDDPLDKAFGLSGLIAALNKKHGGDIATVINSVLPLIEAHHYQETQRVVELPQEVDKLKSEGNFEDTEVVQKKNKLKVCFLASDNVLLPGYLRASDGGRYDVVVQLRSTNHVNILTRPMKRPDLREVAKLIRAQEYELIKESPAENIEIFRMPGRNDGTPMWYFDPATNSLQNGGVNPDKVEATSVPWDTIKTLVKRGLEEAR